MGTELIRWAIHRARERGCHLVQLTTDKEREDALNFYERFVFKHRTWIKSEL
ncbi:GNAT family N-acetyltransferase [Lysinibacillus fusiformis]|nr:GNAT family N-acetyltransferase [Lysinibacillus fusiformis]